MKIKIRHLDGRRATITWKGPGAEVQFSGDLGGDALTLARVFRQPMDLIDLTSDTRLDEGTPYQAEPLESEDAFRYAVHLLTSHGWLQA